MSVYNKGTNFHTEFTEGDDIGIWFSAIQHVFVASLGNCLPFSMEGNQPLPCSQHDATITHGVLSSTDQGVSMESQWVPTPWHLTEQ